MSKSGYSRLRAIIFATFQAALAPILLDSMVSRILRDYKERYVRFTGIQIYHVVEVALSKGINGRFRSRSRLGSPLVVVVAVVGRDLAPLWVRCRCLGSPLALVAEEALEAPVAGKELAPLYVRWRLWYRCLGSFVVVVVMRSFIRSDIS